MEIQPGCRDGFRETGKSGDCYGVSAGFQRTADQDKRADIPGGTDRKKGDFHEKPTSET